MSKLTFNLRYLALSILLFLSEWSIEKYAHDDFIRPYFGDFLVVILLYCLIRSFLNLATLSVCLFVLALSFSIEFAQYLNLVKALGLEDAYWAKILLGNSFSVIDLLAYFLGISLVYILEISLFKNKSNAS